MLNQLASVSLRCAIFAVTTLFATESIVLAQTPPTNPQQGGQGGGQRGGGAAR